MKKPKFIPEFDDIPTPRAKMPELALEERRLSFAEVDLGFDEELALAEAARCLSCRRCIGCGLCLAECDRDAIIYDQKPEVAEITFPAGANPTRGHAHGAIEIFYVIEGILGHVVNGELHRIERPSFSSLRPDPGHHPRAHLSCGIRIGAAVRAAALRRRHGTLRVVAQS